MSNKKIVFAVFISTAGLFQCHIRPITSGLSLGQFGGSGQQIALTVAVGYSFIYSVWKSYTKLVKVKDPSKQDPVGFVTSIAKSAAKEMGLVTHEEQQKYVQELIESLDKRIAALEEKLDGQAIKAIIDEVVAAQQKKRLRR